MTSKKTIDFLSEDSIVSGQKFACISIVGPFMPQKCDVWGMKVKYVCNTLDEAKVHAKRLNKNDPDYHVFIVEVGKWFPLSVEPNEIEDSEYQLDQLNNLMKSYKENRVQANDQWQERKQSLMDSAIREGKDKQTLQDKVEHPVSVLQRSSLFKDKIKELKEELEAIEEDLVLANDKFNLFTQDEKDEALIEINGPQILDSTPQPKIEEIEEIESEEVTKIKITKVLEELQSLDGDISELKNKMNSVNQDNSPNTFKRLSLQMDEITSKKNYLKEFLEKHQDIVNKYINTNYKENDVMNS